MKFFIKSYNYSLSDPSESSDLSELSDLSDQSDQSPPPPSDPLFHPGFEDATRSSNRSVNPEPAEGSPTEMKDIKNSYKASKMPHFSSNRGEPCDSRLPTERKKLL